MESMKTPLSFIIGLRYTRAKRRNHLVSFISLASLLGRISTALDALPDNNENAALKQELQGSTGEVNEVMQRSIVAFQFYDKLSHI